MKRTYKKACEYCNATGIVSRMYDSNFTTALNQEACPVCEGNRVIIVTEIDDIAYIED